MQGKLAFLYNVALKTWISFMCCTSFLGTEIDLYYRFKRDKFKFYFLPTHLIYIETIEVAMSLPNFILW
jgi:hypothetical protein